MANVERYLSHLWKHKLVFLIVFLLSQTTGCTDSATQSSVNTHGLESNQVKVSANTPTPLPTLVSLKHMPTVAVEQQQEHSIESQLNDLISNLEKSILDVSANFQSDWANVVNEMKASTGTIDFDQLNKDVASKLIAGENLPDDPMAPLLLLHVRTTILRADVSNTTQEHVNKFLKMYDVAKKVATFQQKYGEKYEDNYPESLNRMLVLLINKQSGNNAMVDMSIEMMQIWVTSMITNSSLDELSRLSNSQYTDDQLTQAHISQDHSQLYKGIPFHIAALGLEQEYRSYIQTVYELMLHKFQVDAFNQQSNFARGNWSPWNQEFDDFYLQKPDDISSDSYSQLIFPTELIYFVPSFYRDAKAHCEQIIDYADLKKDNVQRISPHVQDYQRQIEIAAQRLPQDSVEYIKVLLDTSIQIDQIDEIQMSLLELRLKRTVQMRVANVLGFLSDQMMQDNNLSFSDFSLYDTRKYSPIGSLVQDMAHFLTIYSIGHYHQELSPQLFGSIEQLLAKPRALGLNDFKSETALDIVYACKKVGCSYDEVISFLYFSYSDGGQYNRQNIINPEFVHATYNIETQSYNVMVDAINESTVDRAEPKSTRARGDMYLVFPRLYHPEQKKSGKYYVTILYDNPDKTTPIVSLFSLSPLSFSPGESLQFSKDQIKMIMVMQENNNADMSSDVGVLSSNTHNTTMFDGSIKNSDGTQKLTGFPIGYGYTIEGQVVALHWAWSAANSPDYYDKRPTLLRDSLTHFERFLTIVNPGSMRCLNPDGSTFAYNPGTTYLQYKTQVACTLTDGTSMPAGTIVGDGILYRDFIRSGIPVFTQMYGITEPESFQILRSKLH